MLESQLISPAACGKNCIIWI